MRIWLLPRLVTLGAAKRHPGAREAGPATAETPVLGPRVGAPRRPRITYWGKRLQALALGAGFLAAQPALAAEQRAIPVPRVTIYPGDALTLDMLVDRSFPVAWLKNRAAADSPEALAGKIAKRTLLPGYPIDVNAITEPDVVSKNVPVQIVFRNAGLTITSLAAPLQAGRVGDVVSVRNVDSGITLRGVVQADGTIRVGRM